jgi:hypothetical protein
MGSGPTPLRCIDYLLERMQDEISEGFVTSLLWGPVEELSRSREYLGAGISRGVFMWEPGWVVKAAIRDSGLYANAREANLYERYGKEGGIPYAECRLVEFAGVDVLVMEWVEHDFRPLLKQPSWVMRVDCAQVGFDREGNLVAYDYG